MLKRTRSLSTLFALLSLGASALAADLASGVTGVIRNPQGVPQMGVLVELLHGNIVATAFTDLQGRYHFAQVTPGVYDLRTSATLFLPTLHRSLSLRAGSGSTINLTLTGLFDETGWLTPHHSGKSDVEDWKWTLRSPANRPMLRILDDTGEADLAVGPEAEAKPTRARHAKLVNSSTQGGLGASTSQLTLELGDESSDHRSSDRVHVSEGISAGAPGNAAMSAVAFRETGRGQGIQRRTLAGVRSAPQVQTQAGSGVAFVEIDTAQRMELGSMAALEVGGQTQVLHTAGGTLIAMHPFVQASARAGVWLVRYQYATSPESIGFESVVDDQMLTRLPTVVQGEAGLLTEAGAHQECAVGRSLGPARIEVSGFRDTERHVALSGALGRRIPGSMQMSAANRMVDQTNGAFRELVPGFTGAGMRVAAEAPLGQLGRLTAAYVNGLGLAEQSSHRTPGSARRASAVYVAVKHELPKSGTQVAVSYRWQPASMMTTVGRYERADVSPYLGVHVLQALPMGRNSGWHTELLLDATNLLQEGYHSAVDPSQELLYASALREMRAGVAVTF